MTCLLYTSDSGTGDGGPVRLEGGDGLLPRHLQAVGLDKGDGRVQLLRPCLLYTSWGEGPGSCRPGYGLYDRALGIMYMWGVWDMLDKLDAEQKESK